MIYMLHKDGPCVATIEHQGPLGRTVKESMESLGWKEVDESTFNQIKDALEDEGIEPEKEHYSFQYE